MKRWLSSLFVLIALAALFIKGQSPSNGANYSPYSYFGWAVFTIPPLTGWTWDNQGTSTEDLTYGYPYLSIPSQAATHLSLRYRTAPSTPYTFTAAISFDGTGGIAHAGNGQATGPGLFFRDGSGKIDSFFIQPTSNSTGCEIDHDKWTNSTTVISAYSSYGPTVPLCSLNRNIVWYQGSDDGTNLIWRMSVDGLHWKQWDTISRTNLFASGPTQIGWGSYCNTSQTEMALLSWNVTSP